jgi:tetratricopeptide (TPR) repeat protein
MKDRIKDEEQFYDSQVNLREHFECRDQNLTLFLDYKLRMISAPGSSQQVFRIMIAMTKKYKKNMISLSNLAHLRLERAQIDEAERCLALLKAMGLWERVLADAEMAYAYRRIGPLGHWKCKTRSEKVVYLRGYPSLAVGAEPAWLDELKIEYSYEAALVMQRLFNETGHSREFFKDKSPEELMREFAKFLKTIVFSCVVDSYRTIGLLMLCETFQHYRRMYPARERSLTVGELGWEGLYSLDDCLAKAVEAVETKGLPNAHFRELDMLGNVFRKRGPEHDLGKAKRYLKQAAKLSKKPAIHHHLALIYRQKWLDEKHLYDKANPNANIRDPGQPLLQKAITHMEKANEYSHGTSVLFHVELARLKYSYSEEPISEESREEIMDILNECSFTEALAPTTHAVQAYLFHQLAFMHKELFHDTVKHRQYLQLSVEKAVIGKNYSDAMPQLLEIVKAESSESNSYKNLGKMYTIFERYSNARWNLEKAKEMHPDDPDIEEDLAVSLIGLGEFHAARHCLLVLKKMDPTHLKVPENRERYIDVSLKVARQFNVDVAASIIYTELIEELKPNIGASTIVVVSSEEKSDEDRTQALVRMIREGLGCNEDNCILPMEAIWRLHGEDMKEREYTLNHIEFFVKKAWCIIIHLTDVILGEGMESLLRDIDNSIKDIWRRKGQVVIVDDVSAQDCTDWQESTRNMKYCQPWISYRDLFLTTPINAASATGGTNEAKCERVEDILSVNEPTENTVFEGMIDIRRTDQVQLPASEQIRGLAAEGEEVPAAQQIEAPDAEEVAVIRGLIELPQAEEVPVAVAEHIKAPHPEVPVRVQVEAPLEKRGPITEPTGSSHAEVVSVTEQIEAPHDAEVVPVAEHIEAPAAERSVWPVPEQRRLSNAEEVPSDDQVPAEGDIVIVAEKKSWEVSGLEILIRAMISAIAVKQ